MSVCGITDANVKNVQQEAQLMSGFTFDVLHLRLQYDLNLHIVSCTSLHVFSYMIHTCQLFAAVINACETIVKAILQNLDAGEIVVENICFFGEA